MDGLTASSSTWLRRERKLPRNYIVTRRFTFSVILAGCRCEAVILLFDISEEAWRF